MKVSESILEFSEIPYERELEDRALYPSFELNYITGGIVRGTLSVIAGEPGAGKTSFVSDTINTIIKDDSVMGIFGEGTLKDQQIKMYRQMTPFGKDNYEYTQFIKNGRKTNIGGYFVDEDSEKAVREKTKGRLFLYDTKYGMSIPKIIEAMDYARTSKNINYFVIDNLSQIELATESENKELKDGIELLRRYAIDNFVGIILVAHYRKQQDTQQIRRILSEIMGTSAVGQKVATAINVIRTDNLDKTSKPYQNFKKLLELNNWDIEQCSCVLEVMKSRNDKLGFVCLGFNKTTQKYFDIKKINPEVETSDNPILHADLTPITDTDEQKRIEEIFNEVF